MAQTDTPAEQEPVTKVTTIETVSVKVKVELDAGYLPFIRYMKRNNWKQPPFGMRDATRVTMDIFMSAKVGDNVDVDHLATDLAERAYAIADRELRNEYPDSFPAAKAEAPQVPEESYIIASTTIERQTAEDF